MCDKRFYSGNGNPWWAAGLRVWFLAMNIAACQPGETQPASGLSSGKRAASFRGESDLADADEKLPFLTEVRRAHLIPSNGHVIGKPADIVADEEGIWLADALEANIKRFAWDGRHLTTLGQSGDGPGEFREPVSIAALRGGGIAVLDRRRMRVSIWSPTGTEVTSWTHRMILANSVNAVEGRILLTGIARTPDGEAMIHEADLRGNLLQAWGRAPPIRHPGEGSFRVYIGDRVGPLHVATHSATSTVWELHGDETSTLVVAPDVAAPWDWSGKPDGSGAGLQTWLEKQVWTTALFAVDSSHYVVGLGFPVPGERRFMYRYALVQSGRGQVSLSEAVDLELISGGSGYAFGVHPRTDGSADLVVYRLEPIRS